MLFLSLFFPPRFICVYFKIFEQHRHHFIPSLRSLFLNCQLFHEVEKTPKSWYSSSRDNKCLLCEIAFKAHFCTTDFFFFFLAGPNNISREQLSKYNIKTVLFISINFILPHWCCLVSSQQQPQTVCIKCFPEKSRGVIECDGRIYLFFSDDATLCWHLSKPVSFFRSCYYYFFPNEVVESGMKLCHIVM